MSCSCSRGLPIFRWERGDDSLPEIAHIHIEQAMGRASDPRSGPRATVQRRSPSLVKVSLLTEQHGSRSKGIKMKENLEATERKTLARNRLERPTRLAGNMPSKTNRGD